MGGEEGGCWAWLMLQEVWGWRGGERGWIVKAGYGVGGVWGWGDCFTTNGCSKVSYAFLESSQVLSYFYQDYKFLLSRLTFKRGDPSTSNVEHVLIKETPVGFYECEHKLVQAGGISNICKSGTMNSALCKMASNGWERQDFGDLFPLPWNIMERKFWRMEVCMHVYERRWRTSVLEVLGAWPWCCCDLGQVWRVQLWQRK